MMETLPTSNWFARHRTWEDIVSAGLGILVIVSAILAGSAATTAVFVSAGVAGVLIFALAMMELVFIQRWEEKLEIVCGAWVIVSPLVLGYSGALRMSHFFLGALVVALAAFELWQDRDLPAAG